MDHIDYQVRMTVGEWPRRWRCGLGGHDWHLENPQPDLRMLYTWYTLVICWRCSTSLVVRGVYRDPDEHRRASWQVATGWDPGPRTEDEGPTSDSP